MARTISLFVAALTLLTAASFVFTARSQPVFFEDAPAPPPAFAALNAG